MHDARSRGPGHDTPQHGPGYNLWTIHRHGGTSFVLRITNALTLHLHLQMMQSTRPEEITGTIFRYSMTYGVPRTMVMHQPDNLYRRVLAKFRRLAGPPDNKTAIPHLDQQTPAICQ